MIAPESEPLEVQQMRPKVRPILKLLLSLGTLSIASFKLCSGGSLFGRALGELCGEGEDCRSGTCITTGILGVCSKSCEPSDPDSCPQQLDCARMAGGHYCYELRSKGALCTGSDQCKSGACLPDPDAEVIMGHLMQGSARCAAQ